MNIRMSEEQYAARQKKNTSPKAETPLTRMQALGRLKQGEMNNTEKAYGAHLEALKYAGRVLWYKFEGIKFRLADNTFYSPDFAVMLDGGVMEIHEVKGHWTDDARVKIKVAASMYPFKFIAVKKVSGQFIQEEF